MEMQFSKGKIIALVSFVVLIGIAIWQWDKIKTIFEKETPETPEPEGNKEAPAPSNKLFGGYNDDGDAIVLPGVGLVAFN